MKQLPPLTGIRFIAVVMIFLFHYNAPVFGRYLQAAFHQCYLGVNVFFVLSGFLICYNYGKEASLKGPFLKAYYINRIARIIPLYYLLLTFTFIVLHVRHEGGNHLLSVYLLNLSFLKGYSQWYMFTGIYPTWSLTPEMTFYLLFPFIYLLITRFNWWWQQIVFFWAVGLMLYLFFYFFPFRGFFQGFNFLVSATFFARCFEFFAGMWIASRFWRWQAKNEMNDERLVKRLAPVYTLSGAGISLFVIIIAAVISPDNGVGQYPVGMVLNLFVFPIGIAILIFGLITESTWFSRLLSSSLFQVLGKSSYAFFLIHGGIIANWLYSLWKGNQLLFFISLVLTSMILYYLVERPINKWMKIRTGKVGKPIPLP
jgi:peptidoglycan/LPS O-acetylase OafA/YrhL